jgi:hypothetical protein
VGFAQLQNHSAYYDCGTHAVSQTLQIDSDSDNVFDTYGIKLCDQDSIQTFPIMAIGNITKWPPMGVPTHSLAFNNNGQSASFLETYYDLSGNVVAWFEKPDDNDTVFFHDKSDSYTPPNFSVDSSKFYIQSCPNPANAILNIHYVVKQARNIQIQLLTYEGNLISNILNNYSPQGQFNMPYDVHTLDEGYYILRFANGPNVYSITIAIIR